MAITAADYDEILTATVQEHGRKLKDQLVTAHPVLDFVADIKSDLSGQSFFMPLETAENQTTTTTDASGTVSAAAEGELLSGAKYDVASPIVTTTRLPWAHIQGNSGKNQVFDLVKTHIKGAMKAQKKAIAGKLWAPTTAAGDFLSLPSIVSDSGVIGGIDPAAHSFWKSKVFHIAPEDMSMLKAVRYSLNRIAKDASEAPDVAIFGLEAFEELEDEVLDKGGRYDVGSGMDKAQTRFRQYWVGDLLCRLDVDAPSKSVYFLRKDSLTFRPVAGNFLRFEEKRQAPATVNGKITLDWVTPVVTYAILGCDERRANGVLVREAAPVAP